MIQPRLFHLTLIDNTVGHLIKVYISGRMVLYGYMMS